MRGPYNAVPSPRHEYLLSVPAVPTVMTWRPAFICFRANKKKPLISMPPVCLVHLDRVVGGRVRERRKDECESSYSEVADGN